MCLLFYDSFVLHVRSLSGTSTVRISVISSSPAGLAVGLASSLSLQGNDKDVSSFSGQKIKSACSGVGLGIYITVSARRGSGEAMR